MKPKRTSESGYIRRIKSSSGKGTIVPMGLRAPDKSRWLKSKPQAPVKAKEGIWATRNQ